MSLITEGLVKAYQLLTTLDGEILEVTWLTLRVSGTATLISLVIGIPLGTFLATVVFPGRKILMSLVNTGMGLPPVVAGLWVSILLWRYGPLGYFGILYTPAAMIIAQAVIASPIVVGLTMAAIQQVDPKLKKQIVSLGATRLQYLWLVLREARLSLLAAVMAGFGAVASEIGASMMVGGNIKGHTRVLTTATVMEVQRGNFGLAIAISMILMILAYTITFVLTHIQQESGKS